MQKEGLKMQNVWYKEIGEYTPIIQLKKGDTIKSGSYPFLILEEPKDINGTVKCLNLEKKTYLDLYTFWGATPIEITNWGE